MILKKQKTARKDWFFAIVVLVIAVWGTVMVFSAGSAYAEARYDDGLYFAKRQFAWLVIGIAIMLLASKIDPSVLEKYASHFYIGTILLLILVLVVGMVGNGAKRWISIGPLTIQPSEIVKLTMPMLLARYFSKRETIKQDNRKERRILIYETLIPLGIMLLPIILVALQKHLSCVVILGTIGIILIFLSGINPKYIYFFCIIGILAITFMALFTDYTKERIITWQDPESYKLTGGWQTLQGLMAIGSGGLFGVGLGNSALKHCYVSEPANDMIFTILCEETGFVGATITIALYAVLIARGCTIAMRSEKTFTRLLCLGICTKTAVQTLLNIAVVTNTVPNTGISLPFFSYGGSSLIMLFFEMGLILSASQKAKIMK